ISNQVNFTLSNNVENLTLAGTGNCDGTGNALVNVINGNSGVNTLDGQGGADTLAGGAGNDVYIVDDTSDALGENANEGTDLIKSSISWTLGTNFENLTLTGSNTIDGTGNGSDNVLTGNGAVNVLTGNGGNDTLDGQGGADHLIGGTGNDTYVVDNSS